MVEDDVVVPFDQLYVVTTVSLRISWFPLVSVLLYTVVVMVYPLELPEPPAVPPLLPPLPPVELPEELLEPLEESPPLEPPPVSPLLPLDEEEDVA